VGSWHGNPRNPTSTATIGQETSCRIDGRYEQSIGPSAEITTLGCQRSSVGTSGHKLDFAHFWHFGCSANSLKQLISVREGTTFLCVQTLESGQFDRRKCRRKPHKGFQTIGISQLNFNLNVQSRDKGMVKGINLRTLKRTLWKPAPPAALRLFRSVPVRWGGRGGTGLVVPDGGWEEEPDSSWHRAEGPSTVLCVDWSCCGLWRTLHSLLEFLVHPIKYKIWH
jgi:hypothetical protein